MTTDEWSIAIGLITSLALVAGPWMFKVHAKLAVIATKLVVMCEKLEFAAAEHRKLWEVYHRHGSRLDTHDVQISHISERLKKE